MWWEVIRPVNESSCTRRRINHWATVSRTCVKGDLGWVDYNFRKSLFISEVHTFWEGHKILQNFHCKFALCSANQIYGGGFAKFRGLLKIWTLSMIKKEQDAQIPSYSQYKSPLQNKNVLTFVATLKKP
jgi:hypothetical protein